MERGLAPVSNQANPSRIGMSSSMAMGNGAAMPILLGPSGFNTNFPLPDLGPTHRNPRFHPSRLRPPFQNRLTSFPCPTNLHGFNPYSYPIRNQAPLIATPPASLHPYTPRYSTTPSLLQNHARPRFAYPPRIQQAPEPNKVFTCSVCYKNFPSQQSAAGHRASHSRRVERRRERAVKDGIGNGNENGPNEKVKGKEVKETDSVEVIVIEDSSEEDVPVKKQKRRGRDHSGYESDESVSSKIKDGKGEGALDLSLRL